MTDLKSRYAVISNNLSNVQTPPFDDHMIGPVRPDTSVSTLKRDGVPYGFSFRRNQTDYLLRFDVIEGSITLLGKTLPILPHDARFAIGAVECELSSKGLEIFKDALERLRTLTNPVPAARPAKPAVH